MRNNIIIKFTMFPSEPALQSIYERLIALDERSSARALRVLLYQMGRNSLPHWFENLPTKKFPSTRAKTVRLLIHDPTLDPALADIYNQLLPLTNGERVIEIKLMLHTFFNKESIVNSTVIDSNKIGKINQTENTAESTAPIFSTNQSKGKSNAIDIRDISRSYKQL